MPIKEVEKLVKKLEHTKYLHPHTHTHTWNKKKRR